MSSLAVLEAAIWQNQRIS